MTEEAHKPDSRCPSCLSALDERAALCPVCKSHRSRWKNWLPHVGGLLALVTFVLSGLTFIGTTTARYAREARAEDRISIVSLDSSNALVLLNAGDNDAFVTTLELDCSAIGYVSQHPVNKLVRSGEFVSIPLNGPKGVIVGELAESEWQTLIERVRGEGGGGTTLPSFLMPLDSKVDVLRKMNNPFNSLVGRATVRYVSARDARELSVIADPVVVVLTVPRGATPANSGSG